MQINDFWTHPEFARLRIWNNNKRSYRLGQTRPHD
jgi:hypothetical protein